MIPMLVVSDLSSRNVLSRIYIKESMKFSITLISMNSINWHKTIQIEVSCTLNGNSWFSQTIMSYVLIYGNVSNTNSKIHRLSTTIQQLLMIFSIKKILMVRSLFFLKLLIQSLTIIFIMMEALNSTETSALNSLRSMSKMHLHGSRIAIIVRNSNLLPLVLTHS